MGLMNRKERAIAEAMSRLTGVNPFLPERIAFEEEVLGGRFVKTREVWNVDTELGGLNPNLARIDEAVRELLPTLQARLADGTAGTDEELELYEDLVLYALYARYADAWFEAMAKDEAGRTHPVSAYASFAEDVAHYFELPGYQRPSRRDAAFLFAYGYQTRRAFHHVFRQIFGASLPAARLRAEVWQSIFSHDRGRYRRALHDRMHDFTTLITGESGTGKELVARAIGLSRFIPFDPETRCFTESYTASFHPLNLSALTPTLIESELFGHRKGAFTGAVDDREGWLEACGEGGTVFLDEIGELDGEIQVKLLRVLQTRSFQRIGETRTRRFAGKIIAATNRDLAREMQAGSFREDFYYRLNSDWVRTPTLREQLADHPGGPAPPRAGDRAPSLRPGGSGRDRGPGGGLGRGFARGRLFVAREHPRAGAVRAQRRDPRAVLPARGQCGERPRGGAPRVPRRSRGPGPPRHGRTRPSLRNPRLPPDRQLRRGGPPPRTGPPHREGPPRRDPPHRPPIRVTEVEGTFLVLPLSGGTTTEESGTSPVFRYSWRRRVRRRFRAAASS